MLHHLTLESYGSSFPPQFDLAMADPASVVGTAARLGNLLICQQRILPELENYVGLRLDDHIRQIVAVLHTPQAANFPRQAEIQKRVSPAPIGDSETDFNRGAIDSDPVAREAEPSARGL